MFQQFRQAVRIPAFWCRPKTKMAEQFRDIYGEVYTVTASGKKDGTVSVQVVTGMGKKLEVQKTAEGKIYVNNTFFADGWDIEPEAPNVQP